MADTLRIVVPPTPWPRGAGPLHCPAPPGFERASVFRTGSEAALPCQLERTPEGDRLWWHGPAAAADEAQEFAAFAEDRRRRAPRRVAFSRSAFGWEAAVRGERWAEALLPAAGPPRLRVHYLGQPLLRLGFAGRIGAWRRLGRTAAAQGPVFAALRANYEIADRTGRALAAVRIVWRFFDGPSRRLALELAVELAAISGPVDAMPTLALAFADRAGVATQAGVRPGMLARGAGTNSLPPLRGEGEGGGQASAAEGVSARLDPAPAPTQWLFAETAAATVAAMAAADDTRCRAGDGGALHVDLPADGTLPLGAVRRWRFRILRGTDRHAARGLASAYRDFRYPAEPRPAQ